MHTPGIFISFLAGVLSIASPCILPILPSFMAYLSGISFSQDYRFIDKKNLRGILVLDTILFGLGFSLVVLFLGATVGLIGQTLLLNRPIFEKIAGVIIILFGLQLTGILKIKTLLKEKKLELPQALKKIRHLRSFLIGIFFAFGWAPCYGPIMGAIFTLAATRANFYQAIWLFIFYSLGFLLPLLLIAIFITQLNLWLKNFKNFARISSLISGILVIMLGVMLLTNNANLLANWLNFAYSKSNISFF